MYFEQINIEETHIRLTTDLNNQRLKKYIYDIRFDLKTYIRKNKLFQLSLEPIKVNEDNLPAIIQKMYFSSDICSFIPSSWFTTALVTDTRLSVITVNNLFAVVFCLLLFSGCFYSLFVLFFVFWLQYSGNNYEVLYFRFEVSDGRFNEN